MVRDGCNYFSFWAPFLPFHSPQNQNFEKWKKPWTYHHFTYVYQKLWSDDVRILRYGSWQMYNYFSFWAILSLLPPSNPKNQHFEKMKKCLEISSFYICVSKFMIRWCVVPEIWCMTDGQTEGRMEKATYRGGCPT